MKQPLITHPALRYHGGKFRLAPWIISHFPEHRCYVEPFGGAASVLLRKERSPAEVYNDLDGDVVNFFRVLRDPVLSKKLAEQVELTPYSRDEFYAAYETSSDSVEQARKLVVRAQMAFGSAGATKGTTGFMLDTKRGCGATQRLWKEHGKTVLTAANRLQGVLIENKKALSLIEDHDSVDTLFYVDPPYLPSTRSIGSNRYYRHEMNESDHIELLEGLKKVKGIVLISGYESELYNDLLSGWEKKVKSTVISSNKGGRTANEVLWISPNCTSVNQGLNFG